MPAMTVSVNFLPFVAKKSNQVNSSLILSYEALEIRTIEKVEIVIMERLEVSEIKKQLHQQRSKKQQT